jgi:hypothetical protein
VSPIPLTSFRILDYKRNWQKSFDEIVHDDELDYKEFLEHIVESKSRFFDSETGHFGVWDGAPKEIVMSWLNFFVLVMRSNVKTSWITIGQNNRGIPDDVVTAYRNHNSKRLEGFQSIMLSASVRHFYFLNYHMSAAKESRSKGQFLDYLFEENYLTLIESAHELLKKNPFFGDETLDLPALIRELRMCWIQEFKQIGD